MDGTGVRNTNLYFPKYYLHSYNIVMLTLAFISLRRLYLIKYRHKLELAYERP